MSYKIFGGIHDILTSVSALKSIPANQREKGQMVAVRDGDYKVYIWDPTATAKGLLCSLAGEDPAQTLWPSKASTWYPGAQGQSQNLPSSFVESDHMVEEAGVRFEQGTSVREDFGYLFAVPNDISFDNQGSAVDYTNLPGRWVVINYATLIDNISWKTRAGHLIPRYNEKFDIGNAELKVRHQFLSDNSIWLGEQHRVSVSTAGTLKFQKRKIGKIPEHLSTYAASSHGGAAEARRRILQEIKDDSGIPASELDSVTITTGTDVPGTMNLSLKHWEKIAIVLGFTSPEPGTLFGVTDFEDAVNLESSTAPSNSDIDTRLADVESKFDGLGKIGAGYVDPSIFDMPEYISKWDERLNLETDIVRGVFDNLFDGRFNTKDVVDSSGFGTLYDARFGNDFDTRLGTKDVVLGTADWADMQSRFDGSGRLKVANAHPDLANANVPPVDLSGYATTTALADKLDTSGFSAAAGQWASNDLAITAEDTGQMRLVVDGTIINSTNSTWLGNNSTIAGMQTNIAGKQPAGAYLQTGDTIDADDIAGTLEASIIPNLNASKITAGTLGSGRIPTLSQGKVTGLAALSADVSTNTTNIGTNSAGITTADSRQLVMDDALYELYKIAVTSEGTAITYKGRNDNRSTYSTDPIGGSNSNIAAAFSSKIASDSTITGLTTSLAGKASITSVNNLQSGLVSQGILTPTQIGLSSFYNPPALIISDKDLKNIIRAVPVDEITTNYHLIGLTTFEYEWNQTADDLFGLSGHVTEGFIAEQLEELYPAADPQNPPTSKDDGHIWWHEYMSDEQKDSSAGVHNYYTFFNSEMLQAEIDAAIAAL